SGGADQPVTVQAGESPAQVTFVNQREVPETGNVRIVSTGEQDQPAGGGCYTVGATAVCDNGPGDADASPGVILIQGLLTGEYTVAETDAPEGYQQNTTSQTATVEADQTAEVTFTHQPVPPETGQVQFELRDPDGNLVQGGCLALSRVNQQQPELIACDGGPEDLDNRPGFLRLELPVGTYSAVQSQLPGGVATRNLKATFLQGGSTLPAGLSLDERTFTVRANVIIIVIIIIIIQLPDEGDLVIIKRAEDTNLLQGGACFRVTGPDDVEICDNDGVDANATTGIIRFNNLHLGSYTVKETQAPPGYQPAADQTVVINIGTNTITIKDPPVPVTTGDVVVRKYDEEGNLLPGACFELLDGATVVAGPVCDADDGSADGVIRFHDIEKGTYTLRETQVPSPEYDPAPDQIVEVIAGTEQTFAIVNTLKPGNILITKLDQNGGGPLPGACFGLDRGAGLEYEVCDQGAGDGDLEEGIISIQNVPAGEWTLIETQAPVGYDPAPNQTITVEPGQTLNLQIKNQPEVPPAEKGNLTVKKVDAKGNPLPGACFSLKQGVVTKVPSRCDSADGANDGTITFTGIAVGTYTLHETQPPSASYEPVADTTVTITANTTKVITIKNTLKRGRILVKKVDQKGQPVQNACFDLAPDGAGAKCTDASGQVVFDNLDSTIVYKLTETKAPLGYVPVPPKTNIVVQPGLTTTITIVDKKAPPPPDTGSIRVIKFFCPAGKSGEATVFYDSSDPGTKKLAQTANCKKGNASFTLDPQGPGETIEFNTGADGEYQATLPTGTYVLTEKATGASVEVEIFLNQQTTVVVLNFVKPQKPKPVTIKVTKYTCEPGFAGVYYSDFVDNCAYDEALTNGVTFRVAGAATQKRVTGDGGQKGKTTFSNLPAGFYTLEEEPPAGVGTVYGFCGWDPNNPEFKTVDEDISFNLGQGDVFSCTFFNIPEEVTDTTGVIVIHKYVCDLPPLKRPANFDWFNECAIQTTGVKFALSLRTGGLYKPVSTGMTNPDGILRFGMLKPGTYQIKEVGGDWCHAESDSVDAQGNVIVKAGQRANVWIFNCVPTKEPPNTGAGTTAGQRLATLGVAPDEPSGGLLLLNAVWPLLGITAYGWYRRRPRRRAA
ncbi:MAG: hypothetical protein C4346_10465, partial [Chloroflexota bacterium]